MDFNENRRLEKAVNLLAKSRGYDGDIFVERPPQIGTIEQEKEAIFLAVDVRPRPKTVEAREQVREWARAIVLTSTTELVELVGN